MRYLFISDLHLEAKRPDITRAFLHCLEERAAQADELYILGDFFEVWLGDDDPNPLARDIAAALARLADAGVKTYLMHGNRDFMLGKRFCREARCTLLPDPYVMQIDGRKVLLMHGDSLCTDDLAYQRMRRALRNPLSLLLIRNLPLKTRHKLGRKLRDQSKVKTQQKAAEITDVNLGEVAEVMRNYNVQTLIHGHTHRPFVHDLVINGEPAKRYVLGDWDKRGWLLEIVDGEYKMESFDLPPPA